MIDSPTYGQEFDIIIVQKVLPPQFNEIIEIIIFLENFNNFLSMWVVFIFVRQFLRTNSIAES